MALKDLLVHLDDTPASATRLQAALALAERCGAQVTALYLIAEPFLPGQSGRHLPAELLREHLAHGEAEAEAVLASARAEAERHGLPLTVIRASSPLDRLPQLLARHARYTDLTVVGQADLAAHGVDDTALVEAAFMDSGHPALVIPRASTGVLPPRRAVIAWDGSREAARATSDALPLLRMAEQVLVLVLDAHDVGGRAGGQPGSELVAHLGRHEVKAELRQVASGGTSIAQALLGQVREEAADLLVMGGYGHSRLREMMLGGTTRSILEHMTVPVLFSH
jgi:nucleotide-binding universal stress UspA family protein